MIEEAMDSVINIVIFILGSIFSVVLVPLVEQKKNDLQAKRSLDELMIELEDIHKEINEHIEQNFTLIFNIRNNPHLIASGEIPISLPKEIETTVLMDLYKKSSLILNSSQRIVIKRISRKLMQIMEWSQKSVDKYLNEREYCIQSLKNTVKLSCHLANEINTIRYQGNRADSLEHMNSNDSTIIVLKSLGFSDEQIQISCIHESKFSDLKVDI